MATEFGTDTVTVPVLRTGRKATGVTVVAMAAFNRLRTPNGTLREDGAPVDYGFDLAGYVGSIQSDAEVASVPGRIAAELRKDTRIADARAEVTRSTVDGGLEAWAITITCQTEEGPFELQVLASELSLDLVGIRS